MNKYAHHMLHSVLCPMEPEHRQNDSRLSLPHIQLVDGPGQVGRVVNEVLGDPVLGGPDLKLALNLKHQPLRVLNRVPRAVDLQLLCAVYIQKFKSAAEAMLLVQGLFKALFQGFGPSQGSSVLSL